ncbi:hypothetical protein PR048_027148 [Dryococelus australis]|uniref:Uncharacterized protein n=1 Tax=Dryococelus australis TaxID=614101 RepID=A0ABQ9GEN1_9NEOP|nr:hypothetical protein PR048_027148 [Dryococelus australis]
MGNTVRWNELDRSELITFQYSSLGTVLLNYVGHSRTITRTGELQSASVTSVRELDSSIPRHEGNNGRICNDPSRPSVCQPSSNHVTNSQSEVAINSVRPSVPMNLTTYVQSLVVNRSAGRRTNATGCCKSLPRSCCPPARNRHVVQRNETGYVRKVFCRVPRSADSGPDRLHATRCEVRMSKRWLAVLRLPRPTTGRGPHRMYLRGGAATVALFNCRGYAEVRVFASHQGDPGVRFTTLSLPDFSHLGIVTYDGAAKRHCIPALLHTLPTLTLPGFKTVRSEISVEQRRNARGGGNGRSPRKPANQRHRPARFPRAKIWGIEPCSPWREASNLTTSHQEPTRRMNNLDITACIMTDTRNTIQAQHYREDECDLDMKRNPNVRLETTQGSGFEPRTSRASHRYTQNNENTTRQFRALLIGVTGHLIRLALSPLLLPRFSASGGALKCNAVRVLRILHEAEEYPGSRTSAGRGRGGRAVSSLASHQGDPGSIPCRILACGNSAGRCRWPFPPPPSPLHSGTSAIGHPASTRILAATQEGRTDMAGMFITDAADLSSTATQRDGGRWQSSATVEDSSVRGSTEVRIVNQAGCRSSGRAPW